MINECEEHGYYRDDFCPVCGEKGKFVMSDYEVEKMGRTLAAILRHGMFLYISQVHLSMRVQKN